MDDLLVREHRRSLARRLDRPDGPPNVSADALTI
jgi:hypothetical protein